MPAQPGQTSPFFKLWMGVCLKGGGSLGPGTEAYEGYFFNMGDPDRSFWGGADSWRIGFGLGASVGLTVVLVVNCTDPTKDLDGITVTDWGIDFAMVEKWSCFAGAFKNYEFYKTLLEWGKLQEGVMPLARYQMLNKQLMDIKTTLLIASAGIIIFGAGWLLQQMSRPR